MLVCFATVSQKFLLQIPTRVHWHNAGPLTIVQIRRSNNIIVFNWRRCWLVASETAAAASRLIFFREGRQYTTTTTFSVCACASRFWFIYIMHSNVHTNTDQRSIYIFNSVCGCVAVARALYCGQDVDTRRRLQKFSFLIREHARHARILCVFINTERKKSGDYKRVGDGGDASCSGSSSSTRCVSRLVGDDVDAEAKISALEMECTFFLCVCMFRFRKCALSNIM